MNLHFAIITPMKLLKVNVWKSICVLRLLGGIHLLGLVVIHLAGKHLNALGLAIQWVTLN